MNTPLTVKNDCILEILCFILLAFSSVVPRALEASCLLLLIYSFFSIKKWKINGELSYICLLLVILFAFLTGTTNSVYDGAKSLDTPARYLLALPFVMLLIRSHISPSSVFKSFVSGAVLAGMVAIIQYFVLGYGRATGAIFSIFFGNLAALMMVMSFCSWLWFKGGNQLMSIVSIVGFLLGAIALVLSETRGAWIAVPPAMLLVIFLKYRLFSITKIIAALLISLVMVVSCYYLITPVKDRVDTSISEVKEYFAGDREQTVPTSSAGVRFEIWRAAFREFKESPLVGLGFERRSNFRETLIEEGYLVSSDGTGSAHNEVLDALAKRGLLGLIALLLLYFFPMYHFIKGYLSTDNERVKILNISGIAFVLVFVFSGLTERFLYHHVGAMFYGFSMPLIYAMTANYRSGKKY